MTNLSESENLASDGPAADGAASDSTALDSAAVERRRADRIALTEATQAALRGGPALALATVVSGGRLDGVRAGAKLAVRSDGSTVGTIGAIDSLVIEQAVEILAARPRAETVTLYVSPEGVETRASRAAAGAAEVFVQVFEAPARLLVVGGGHVGLALARIGSEVGFDITVLDDREEFANAERFPMADQVLCGDVAETLDGVAIDELTYIVLVSRGHQVDELALRHSVGRGAAYVGMIGSRRRTGTVIERLAADGYERAELDRVHTPIGIDIGSETPEEIALSILAQMVMVRRGGSGRSMREARGRGPAAAE